MSCLLRDNGALFNPELTDFQPESVDDTLSLAHNSGPMTIATSKTTTKTKPSGGSGGVRA
jgi:hypothetical protein